MKKHKYLLVEIDESPRFWLADEVPENRFLLDGIEYSDSNSGDFIGFYDYLRNSAGEIFGIRFLPFEDCGFTQKELILPASENETIDEEISDDQRFGENKLYQTRNGGVLLTFPAPDEDFVANCKISRADFTEIQLKAA